jgi:4-hydroxybutyrate CoA-transferase
VPRLGLRDIVSCPRADADIVVTEHGITRLREKSLAERAEALIGVAAPAFREELANGQAGPSG